MEKGLSLKQTKFINISTVLKVISVYGPISRSEISEMTQLSPTTCTAVTKGLLQKKVIQEIGEGTSSGGRKPIMLQLNHSYGYVIGVRRDRKTIRCSIYNLGLKEVHHETVVHDTTFEASFEKLIQCVETAIIKSGIKQVLGMTISTNGIIDTVNQTIVGAYSLDSEEVMNYSHLFTDIFDFPVYIENDSNILAYAEKYLNYQPHDSLVHIQVGSGIGAGVVLGNQMMRGRYGYVGEIGHITLDRNGPLCYCGNKGCLEALAGINVLNHKIDFAIKSGTGHLEGLSQDSDHNYNLEDLLNAANAGNRVAKDLIQEEADYIYHAVIGVINHYDPEIITISGFGSVLTQHIVQVIYEKIGQTIYKYQLSNRHIGVGDQRHDLAEIGAALNSYSHLFEDHLITKALL